MMFVNLGLLILSLVLMVIRQPKVSFSNADPQYINAFIELPLGSDIETKTKL